MLRKLERVAGLAARRRRATICRPDRPGCRATCRRATWKAESNL